MEQGIGWLFVIVIWVVMGVALVGGILYLQLFLSGRQNKIAGLVLPILYLPSFAIGFMLTDVVGLYSLWSNVGIMAVLLGIYFYKRKQMIKLTKQLPDTSLDKLENHLEKAIERLYIELDRDKVNKKQVEESKMYAVNHIGFMLNWLCENEFLNLSATITEEDVESITSGGVTGAEFLLEKLGGKLEPEIISPFILEFVQGYYSKNYFKDYTDWTKKQDRVGLYEIKPSFVGYNDFKEIIYARHEKYLSNKIAFDIVLKTEMEKQQNTE